jgi:exosortase A
MRARWLPLAWWCLLAAVLLWTYRGTLADIVQLWRTNSTFSHGPLILPISAWLAWRNRDAFHATAWVPSWTGAVAVLALVALWVAASGAGVAGVEQFAVVAMIPALVLAVFGRKAASALVFPLAYIMLAVPIGHALVPILMQSTAKLATLALQLTAVPVWQTHMYITIPGGHFEVARACSGLNYVVTGFALGLLYSYVTYSGWRKRLLSVLAFIVVPVVANGLRVYLTILVAHLTDMRYGPGEEHVWFGRVFFLVVIISMFFVGRRWRDADPQSAAVVLAVPPSAAVPNPMWLAALLTGVALVAGPHYLRAAERAIEAQLTKESERLELPAGPTGWVGPTERRDAWRPLYSGARIERAVTYADAAGGRVDLFVAVYGIGKAGGGEMISFGNRMFAGEANSLGIAGRRAVELPAGGAFVVNELTITDGRGPYRVWQWFMVGDRPVLGRYAVKGLESVAFVTHGALTERIVTLAAPIDGSEQDRLQSFFDANARCLGAGLEVEACQR